MKFRIKTLMMMVNCFWLTFLNCIDGDDEDEEENNLLKNSVIGDISKLGFSLVSTGVKSFLSIVRIS